MFDNPSPALVHLPGKPAPTNEAQLPRGECSFIVTGSKSANGLRQRCMCRSFYPDSVIRSRCGCGHQAWHHEMQPISTVTMNEYVQVVEEMKRLKQEVKRYEALEEEMKQELFKERMAREEHFRTFKAIEARLYQNMHFLKVQMDDKVEAVVDKTQEFNDQIKAVQERLTMVDEVTMELENRIDRVEHGSSSSTRDATPSATIPKMLKSAPRPSPTPQLPLPLQSHHSLGQLPIRTDKKYPSSWSVRVIFVPRKSQKYAYDPDSIGYRRCATRKLQQNLEFPSPDSSCFANRIETAFKGIIRGRPWMPMSGHRPADEPFGRMALQTLPPDLIVRDVWDYPFLEDHCIAHDKMQGDVLYFTLQYEDVTWNEIRFLPAVLGADETCWKLDEELDGPSKYKNLDSEIMYDYQEPPPYSSRTHSIIDRQPPSRPPSKLEVLADSASMLSAIERAQTLSSRYSSEQSSLRSFETDVMDDEHCDKKPKLRPKQSMPSINPTTPAYTMYVSGRSKRKMPVREKAPKEPLHFSVSKWRPALLHTSKGKETVHEHH